MICSAVPLRDLLLSHDTGVWGPEDRDDGISILRSTNFSPDGSIRFENLSFRSIESRKRATKMLAPNDILLEKSGGGPKQPVGRVCLFKGHYLEHAFGNFTMRLRANDKIADPEYLFWCLHRLYLSGGTAEYQKHTSGIRNLESKRYLAQPIPLPPLNDQRRIADLLNRSAVIEHLQTQVHDRFRKFASTLFIKIFGDPIENPMGWERRKLGDIGEVQGGLQVTRKRAGHPFERPYLRVANVLRDRLVLDEIKHIRLTEKELDRIRLHPDDLLIVEGHGNASEIGRVAIWDDTVRDCVHQNHLIRVRLDHSLICTEFACAYLNSLSGRQHLLNSGKTTSGLNTITTSDVRRCTILIPPLAQQNRFGVIVGKVRDSTTTAKLGSIAASTLAASIMANLLGVYS